MPDDESFEPRRACRWDGSFARVARRLQQPEIAGDPHRLLRCLLRYYEAVVRAFAHELLGESPEEPTPKLIADLACTYRKRTAVARDGSLDLFKPLYMELIPRSARKALGEYYTPDWLAEHTLNVVEYDGDPNRRLIDPACGSGTFLLLALRRLIATGRSHGRSPHEIARIAAQSIVGIEVNPAAASAARINSAATLAALLGVEIGPPGATIRTADFVREPPAVGTFDWVVGNPPWIGWESMPTEYRHATLPLWTKYGLLPQRNMDAILGKSKKDLAMLVAYAATDRLLRPGGRLGFVLSQALFKSAGAGRGFRGFRFGSAAEARMRVERVEDFSVWEAFPGVAAKAVVAVWTKGEATSYPVPYIVWSKPTGRSPPNDSSPDRFAQTRRSELQAFPIDASDPASAWLTAAPQALPALRRMLGPSPYRAREGANTGGANGVFWVEVLERHPNGVSVVRNLADAGKRPTPRTEAEVESALLFPLLRGRDLQAWSAAPSAHLLVVQDSTTRKGIPEARLRAEHPNTWNYLKRFEPALRARAALRRYFSRSAGGARTETAPFYSMFNIGTYTLARHKVVWRRMAAPLVAAVVGPVDDRPVVPQETHCFVACDSTAEAHFLAGVFNSKLFRLAVEACSNVGGKGFGSPHLLEWLAVPKFDPQASAHRAVARIAERFAAGNHDATAARALDDAVRALWKLSPDEADAVTSSC